MRDKKLWIAFVIGLAVFVVPVGLLLSRSPVVEISNARVVPPVVRPGEAFELVWTRKTLRECQGVVHRRIVDSQHQLFVFEPVGTVERNVGSIDTVHTTWHAPAGIAPGPAILIKPVDRWCNVMQQWFWPMREEQQVLFTVAE